MLVIGSRISQIAVNCNAKFILAFAQFLIKEVRSSMNGFGHVCAFFLAQVCNYLKIAGARSEAGGGMHNCIHGISIDGISPSPGPGSSPRQDKCRLGQNEGLLCLNVAFIFAKMFLRIMVVVSSTIFRGLVTLKISVLWPQKL